MAVAFSPVSGARIIDTDESASAITEVISMSVAPGDDITGVQWSSDPVLPAQASVTTNIAAGGESATVTVEISDFLGLIPILAIDYLLNGVPGTVTSFGDLPEEAEQVVSYEKTITAPIIYTLTVEVTEAGLDPGVRVGTFEIRVEPNYTAGRDALIAAVDARR